MGKYGKFGEYECPLCHRKMANVGFATSKHNTACIRKHEKELGLDKQPKNTNKKDKGDYDYYSQKDY